MNFTPKAVKALSLASLATALCFASVAAPAQTAVAPAASMPAGQMQHKGSAGASGAKDMKSSMTMGMESMQKMPASGDTDKDFAMMMKMHHQRLIASAAIIGDSIRSSFIRASFDLRQPTTRWVSGRPEGRSP